MATLHDGVNVPDDGVQNVSFKVTTDLSGKQFLAMKISADQTIALQATAGGPMVGILQDKPDGSSTATVGAIKASGFSFAIAGGTCTVGGLGTIITTTGKFVDATGTNKFAPVRFIEGTTTDGAQIVVQIVHDHNE